MNGLSESFPIDLNRLIGKEFVRRIWLRIVKFSKLPPLDFGLNLDGDLDSARKGSRV